MTATGAAETEAADALQRAGGHTETAIVMLLGDWSAEEAPGRLRAAGGRVREAVRPALLASAQGS